MPIYKFVDSIQASPTVLLDLDNKSPLAVVEGTQTSPPPRRVSSSGSAARNGDVVSQKSYPDRQITVRLRFELKTTAEAQAEAIQKLGRLLDGPQWLLWQHDGKTAPVFYRTKFGDIDVDDFMLTSTPTRYLTLNITAEPFSYGLPVTGTATINNDPTHATNPMSFVFPAIQGDVATPLYLDLGLDADCDRTVVVSTSLPSGAWPGVAYIDASAMTTGGAGGSSAWSVISDAGAVGGSYRRLTSTATGQVGYLDITGTLPTLLAGEYRIYARVRGNSLKTWDFTGLDVTRIGTTRYTPHDNVAIAEWVPLGSKPVRLPPGVPERDLAFGINPPQASLNFRFLISAAQAASSVLDVDGFLFVPVGVDIAQGQSFADVYGLTQSRPRLVLDGISDRHFRATSLGVPADDVTGPPVLAGGLPAVTPGLQNVLHLLRAVWADEDIAESDGNVKTLTTVVNYTYIPQYLYDRPATT